jgi:hypothetical protein
VFCCLCVVIMDWRNNNQSNLKAVALYSETICW